MTNKDWRRKLETLLRDNAHYPEKIFVEEALELCIPFVESLLEQERKAAKKEQRTPCCGAPISAPVDGSQNRICTECGEFVTGLKSKL